MKYFKRIFAGIMAIIIALSCCQAAAATLKDDNIYFSVAADIHAKEKDAPLTTMYPENELYFHAANSGNLYTEAMGILKTFFKEAKENKLDFVLLPGDLANSGTQEQHEYFAQVLEEFERDSDIPVYVVPGNHDYKHTSPDEFKNYYSCFGYNEALCTDEVTASYTADLPENWRLIAIDSNDPGNDGDGITKELLDWVKIQAEKAQRDGKKVIAMMHHALLDPIPFAKILMKDFIVRNHEDIAESFTEWGIQYVFTGHEHGNNITSFTGKNGKKVYDILTTSLTSYPLEYRSVALGDGGMDIKCKRITECNFDCMSGDFTESQLELMKKDYTKYSYEYFKFSIEKKISKYTSAEFIENKLKTDNKIICSALETAMPVLEEALTMPLYSDGGEISVEALAAKSGATLPKSDYYNLYDLISSFVTVIYSGGENLPMESSAEGKVLVVALNTMLKYIIAEVGNRTASLALNAAASVIGLDIDKNIELIRWSNSLMGGADDSYEIAFTVLAPLLDTFLVDDDIPDRDVTLPPYGETAQSTEKIQFFADIIVKIIRYIFTLAEKIYIVKFK